MRQKYGTPMTRVLTRLEQRGPAPARPRASVTAPGRLRLVAQTDRSDAGSDVQPGIAFDADRLQRDRAVGAANQHIGSGTHPHGGAAGGADIIAVERTGSQIGGRGEHRPHQNAALGIADIDAELVDGAGIVFRTSRPGRQGAAEALRRAEHEAPAAGDISGQRSDPYAALRLHRRRNADRQRDQTNRQTKPLEHPINLPGLHPHFLPTDPALAIYRLPEPWRGGETRTTRP